MNTILSHGESAALHILRTCEIQHFTPTDTAMKARAMTVLLCLLSALVEVHSQTAPYVIFMGNKISNHGYVDLNRVWTVLGNALRCRTDLYSCCSATQGPDRGDWYFPNGNIVPFFDNVYENHGPQRVSLRYTGSGGPSGIYRCDIETNAVNDNDGRETVYVGLYTSGGEENVEYVHVRHLI